MKTCNKKQLINVEGFAHKEYISSEKGFASAEGDKVSGEKIAGVATAAAPALEALIGGLFTGIGSRKDARRESRSDYILAKQKAAQDSQDLVNMLKYKHQQDLAKQAGTTSTSTILIAAGIGVALIGTVVLVILSKGKKK